MLIDNEYQIWKTKYAFSNFVYIKINYFYILLYAYVELYKITLNSKLFLTQPTKKKNLVYTTDSYFGLRRQVKNTK